MHLLLKHTIDASVVNYYPNSAAKISKEQNCSYTVTVTQTLLIIKKKKHKSM